MSIQNCGGRAARWVTVASAKPDQGKYRLTFARVAVLEPKDSSPLSIEVSEAKGGDPATLDDFLADTARDTYVTWYDIEISFRDTDDSMKEDIARISYWPGERVSFF